MGRLLRRRPAGRLQKVAVSGGAPITIAAAAGNPFGAHWGSSDDTILFSTLEGGLFRMSAAGGQPVRMDSVLLANRSRPAADGAVALTADRGDPASSPTASMPWSPPTRSRTC